MWFSRKKDLSSRQVLSTARHVLRKKFPFFARALYTLIFVEDANIVTRSGAPTVAVTRRAVVLFHPEAPVRWGLDAMVGGLYHELSHFLRRHHQRMARLGLITPDELYLGNVAGDCEINDGMKQLGLVLPEGCIYPETFGLPSGKLMEWYYHQLRQQGLPAPSGGSESASGGPDDSASPDGAHSGSGAQGLPEPGFGHGQCGSCAGNRHPSEPADGRAQGHGRTEAEIERMRREVAKDIQAYGKRAGRVPGSWEIWADDQLTPPKVRWQERLARLGRREVSHRRGMVDYTYTIPSLFQPAVGWGPDIAMMPAMVAPEPNVVFIIDTSLSMMDKNSSELREGMSECRGIISQLGIPLRFAACDAEMQGEIEQVNSIAEATRLMKGGGGTSFVPIFEALKKLKPRPDVVIIGTDGQGPAPAKPPKGISVIWLLVGPNACIPCVEDTNTPINWGSFIFTNERAQAA